MKKSFILPTIALSGICPIVFVVSCSSNESKTNVDAKKKEFEDFLSKNPESIKPITEGIQIKNFVEITNWKNLDDFISIINKYFLVDDSFRSFLSKNDESIFKSIRQVSIQPKVGSQDLTIIFYLDSSTSDSGIVDFVVKNSLKEVFAYANEITISQKMNQEFYDSEKAFDEAWKKVSSPSDSVDVTVLSGMLNKAFDISEMDLKKITDNFSKNYFLLTKTGFQITLSLTKTAINEGFIFKKTQTNIFQYDVEIQSKELVKKQ